MWKFAHDVRDDVLVKGYKEIVLFDNADSIEGTALRQSQLLRVSEDMTEQAKNYSDLYLSIIKWLEKELPEVKITVLMVGKDNHSELRLHNTKKGELPENLQHLVTNMVKNYIDGAHDYGGLKSVEFVTADEILINFGTEQQPYNVLFAHGNKHSADGKQALSQAEKDHDCDVHLLVLGHLHNYSINTVTVSKGTQKMVLRLPSVVGITEYSKELRLLSFPGFVKITIDTVSRVSNAQLIRLN